MDQTLAWGIPLCLIILMCIGCAVKFVRNRYLWYRDVIQMNPETLTMRPVVTEKMLQEGRGDPLHPGEVFAKAVAVRCSFQQYLKYLRLACLPTSGAYP